MSKCRKCGNEQKFGRYFEEYGEKLFECNNCLNVVSNEIKSMMSGQKKSAGQIVKAKIKEKSTLLWKVKKFFGLVKE